MIFLELQNKRIQFRRFRTGYGNIISMHFIRNSIEKINITVKGLGNKTYRLIGGLPFPFFITAIGHCGYIQLTRGLGFVDMPGCITCGETMGSAIANAFDAKKVWIEAALEDGMDIPKPNSLENICGSLNGEYRKVISRVFSERGNRYGGSECKRNENSRNING